MVNNVFIFHGTEGYPEENWFPWLKEKLEEKGCKVFVPQFPSPPIVPAKISEWFAVLKNYEQYIDENTILIGIVWGSVFTLRVLEQLKHPVRAVFLVGAPIGVNQLPTMTETAVSAVLILTGKNKKIILKVLRCFILI